MLQVHGDVFRPPQRSMLLCTYVGVGTQLICMAVVTMIFAVLGFLSPANRGGFMTAVLLLFVFMGVFAGYSAARLYKSFKVIHSRNSPAMTAGPVHELHRPPLQMCSHL